MLGKKRGQQFRHTHNNSFTPMNERGYTPTDEELAPIPLPPSEGNDTAEREPEEPRSFDQQLAAAMEHATGPTRTIFGLMRELNRSKWVHALIFGATVTAQGALKYPEYRELKEAERVVAEQRAGLDQRQESIGDRLKRLDAALGDQNIFSLEYPQQLMEENEQLVRSQRKAFSWLGPPQDVSLPSDPNEYFRTENEPPRALATTDLRGRDPISEAECRIPADSLTIVLHRDFPRGWVDSEITSVTQTDSIRKMSDEYGTGGIEAAHCEDDSLQRSSIVLTGGSRSESMMYTMQQLLPHEIAHANDWYSDAEMTFEERVVLLDEIVQRVTAKDRWQSTYVEKIKNEDPQVQLSNRAAEYWAEIVSAYFHTPTKLHKKDFDIVDRMVRRTDPNFDVRKSIDHRAQVVWDIVNPHPELTEPRAK